MKLCQTELPEVILLEIEQFNDERGTFSKIYSDELLAEPISFYLEEVNISKTLSMGTIRGLHMQRFPYEEKKIVRCVQGAVFDVAVDMRPGSSTYLRYVSRELSFSNNHALVIPEGFAHGFQTLEDNTIVHYLTSQKYFKTHEVGIRFDDPKIGIQWPKKVSQISRKDRLWPAISEKIEL